MLMALKSFQLGLSEGFDAVLPFIEKQSENFSDATLKIGLITGVIMRDGPGALRALEGSSSARLRQEFFETLPLAHALLLSGQRDDSADTESMVSISSDLQLPPALAFEFYAYHIGRPEAFLDFSATPRRDAPDGMFIETLPLSEPQKQELHKRFHAISLDK